MAEVKIWDDLFDSPEFVSLSDSAIACWVRAVCAASSRNETRVPLAQFSKNVDQLIELLTTGAASMSECGQVELASERWSTINQPRSASVREMSARNLEDVTQCAYCRKDGTAKTGPDGHSWHMDHVRPLAAGGKDLPRNIVKACRKCNLEKSKKILFPEFFVQCGDGNTRGPDDWGHE